MTIFTEKPTINRRAYQVGLDDLSSGSGTGAAFDDAATLNPLSSLMRAGEQDMAAEGNYLSGGFRAPPDTPLLEPDAANEQYGIPGQLKFDQPVRQKEAELLKGWATERLERENILRRSDKTLAAGAGRLGAGFLAQALDPINIATAFIPVVGPARYARWIGQATSGAERAGIRAGVGALEGAAGTALVEPIIYAQAQREQRPYDLWDSFTNVVFGAAIGGGLHAAGGAVVDRFTRPSAGERLVQDIGVETHSSALRGAVAALAEDRPIRVAEGITAFHGTPHLFDQFSLRAIGTGEGAQVYGHGLYFAENRKVAKDYADNVMDKPYFDKVNARLSEIAKELDKEAIPGQYGKYRTERGTELKAEYDRLLQQRADKTGNLYETRLKVSKDDLLDWDKPLSEQSEKVRAALRKAEKRSPKERAEIDALAAELGDAPDAPSVNTDYTGRQAYDELVDRLGSSEAASAALREAGIPGLKYLDQGSRADGEGTRNFVIFDDSLVDIVARNDAPIDRRDAVAKINAPDDQTTQRIAAIDDTMSPRIERDEDIATQLQEAEQSLAEIQSLIREGDEATLKASDDLTAQAESEAKAYEVMASCYARRA